MFELGQYQGRLVNGLGGDPAVYWFMKETGDALLFDMGSLEALSNRELLKIRQVFVSHTHIDHFFGFERLLRVNIPHFREITMVGPPGFAVNVQSKLKGFTWNLLESGQIRYRVREVGLNGSVREVLLSNDHRFEPVTVSESAGGDATPVVATLSDGSIIQAAVFEHGTPCLGYCWRSPQQYRVDPDAITQLGLRPGPWVSELQFKYTNGKHDKTIEVGGGQFNVDDLGKKILHAKEPYSFGYLTDVEFSQENLSMAGKLFRQVTMLLCETNFAEQDAAKAFHKKHLTTRQAALIACHVEARQLSTFHISSIYTGRVEQIAKEANDLFHELHRKSPEEIAHNEGKELAKNSALA